MDNSMVIIVIIGIVALFYYQKYKEVQMNYSKLYHKFTHMKAQVKELQMYKNDISKTFQILDTELDTINKHIQRQSQRRTDTTPTLQQTDIPQNINSTTSHHTTRPRISLMTSDILSTLFNNINQEFVEQEQNGATASIEAETESEKEGLPMENLESAQTFSNEYDKYKL